MAARGIGVVLSCSKATEKKKLEKGPPRIGRAGDEITGLIEPAAGGDKRRELYVRLEQCREDIGG